MREWETLFDDGTFEVFASGNGGRSWERGKPGGSISAFFKRKLQIAGATLCTSGENYKLAEGELLPATERCFAVRLLQ